jgi:hypothetical protein
MAAPVEYHLSSAIPIGRLQGIDHLAGGAERQTWDSNGGPGNVAKNSLPLVAIYLDAIQEQDVELNARLGTSVKRKEAFNVSRVLPRTNIGVCMDIPITVALNSCGSKHRNKVIEWVYECVCHYVSRLDPPFEQRRCEISSYGIDVFKAQAPVTRINTVGITLCLCLVI